VKQLELALYPGSISEAPGETLAVAIPSDERPLAGHAGYVDWRTGGAISRQLLSGFASGELGEAVLLSRQRPFSAARVLLFGVGPIDSAGRRLQRAFSGLAERLLLLKTQLAVLALPRAIDFELDCEFLLRGCVQALSAQEGDQRLCLVLPDAEGHRLPLDSALEDVSADARKRRVAVDISWIEAQPATESLAGGSRDATRAAHESPPQQM